MRGSKYDGHIRLKWGRLTLIFRLDDLVVEAFKASGVARTMWQREVVDEERRLR